MKKLTLNQNSFSKLVNNICKDIAVSNWKPDYLVGLTRGGLVPAVMISHFFSIPMYALHVSLRDNTSSNESNLWMAEDAFNGKNILIIDDINDSGATINWILEDWKSGCFPDDPAWNNVWNNNVRFSTVINNSSSQCKVNIDYTGTTINKETVDLWVDFPYENWWSNIE